MHIYFKNNALGEVLSSFIKGVLFFKLNFSVLSAALVSVCRIQARSPAALLFTRAGLPG